MSNAERLGEAMAPLLAEDQIEMSEAVVERMIAALAPLTAGDIVMVMRGTDDSFVGTYEGFDGLREGWSDWLSSWGRLRFEIEEIHEVGDNVLLIGRQLGVTRHGGVEMEHPSAVVWKFRDGLLARVEFHLDRELAAASAAAGLD
jgi:ketosteroid isomerase-like protein